jgi:hypothetical protein
MRLLAINDGCLLARTLFSSLLLLTRQVAEHLQVQK